MATATAAPEDRQSSHSPAYVAFKTFKNFVGHLAEHGVPTKIDKSVMAHLSGGTQSHLSSALRFMGLVGDDGTPDSTLTQLVNAYGDDAQWKEVLGAILKESYADVIGGIDIEKASANELDKCFQAKAMSGVMLDRSVRFYLGAMKDAGRTVSPHIGKRKPRASAGNGGSKKQKAPAKSAPKSAGSTPSDPPADSTPAGMIDYPIHFSGKRSGHIRVPSDLSEDDCKMLELMIPLLRAYAERN